MIYAERGNRVKRISESDIQFYVEQGYTITDGAGTVLKETVPTDVPSLKLAYAKKEKEIESLKAEIAMLSTEVEKLRAENQVLLEASTSPAPTAKRGKKNTITETES